MRKTIEIEVEDNLIQEVMSKYGLHGPREAINLALRVLLAGTDTESSQQDDEYDEFSDLSAWQPRQGTDTG